MSRILSAIMALLVLPAFGVSAQSNLLQYSEYTADFSFPGFPEIDYLTVDLKPGMTHTSAFGQLVFHDENIWPVLVSGTCLLYPDERYLACAISIPLDRAFLSFDLVLGGESEAIYTASTGTRHFSTVSFDRWAVPRAEYEE